MADIRTKGGKLDKRFKSNRDAVKNEKLLQRVRDRHKLMTEADFDNRRDAMADITFVNIRGAQWQTNMKQERGDRPCYEYNKTKIRTKRVVNDIRDNRPSGKVRAVEGGDTEGAELREGLIRNILNVSHSDDHTDQAAEYQIEGGMGAWRVNTKFAAFDAFDQDIVIEGIENPYNLYCDPSAKDFMKRDARDWALAERISHAAFEEKYGFKARKVDFEGDNQFDNEDDWVDEETVRVAEYWYKVPTTKELWLIKAPDPAKPDLMKTTVVDSESDEGQALTSQGFKPERTRTVETDKIMMCVASGEKILEGPVEWAGHIFPFIMVYGEYRVIDGKKYWWGLVRNAKDAQRNYNISKTAIAEAIHQAPKAFTWMTPKQAKGLEDLNAEAHRKNYPHKFYNPDREAPGAPARIGGADVPVALMSQASVDDADLKDVMGVPDASVGVPSGETSGRAIFARQQQGEIANFNYKDNHAKGHELMYEILIDLMPEIYDTERELRVLGSDGAEDYAKVNQVVFNADTGKATRVNDMAAGKYDVTVKTGPSFATLRQEAAEIYSSLGQQFPAIWAVAGDLVMKSMDLPYADDIADRLKTILPPEIQQRMNEDVDMPPEVAQLMQQAQMAMQQVQEHGQLVQEAAQELEGEKALNDQAKAEIKAELAKVAQAKAEFDKHVAESMLKLIEARTGLVTTSADIKMQSAEVKEAAVELGQRTMSETVDALGTAQELDQITATFIEQVGQSLEAIQETTGEIASKVDRKPVGGTIEREGGTITANVDMDDGSTKSLSAIREGGKLRIVGTEEENV
ncbi:MAG: portal protein [Candidatus Thorarchaeota archaeon]